MDWHLATSEGPLGEQVAAGVGGTVVVVFGISAVIVTEVVCSSGVVGRDVETGGQPDIGDC